MKHLIGLLVTGLALTACVQPPAGEQGSTAPQAPAAAQPAQEGADAPHIYMAVQAGGPVATSVIFAIDRNRDNTPSDDPAIRITPENGKCNPQEMQYFRFPAGAETRPIFGPQEAASGVSAEQLPNFMAMAVTSEMLRRGLVVQPDDSKPQNVCTRKLWEQLVINESTGQG